MLLENLAAEWNTYLQIQKMLAACNLERPPRIAGYIRLVHFLRLSTRRQHLQQSGRRITEMIIPKNQFYVSNTF